MQGHLVPQDVLEQVAKRFRLLGDPVRLSILNYLNLRSEATVGEIVEATGQSQANISKHLRVLATDDLVVRRKDGLYAYYRVADPTLNALCLLVCGQIERRDTAVGDAAELTGA